MTYTLAPNPIFWTVQGEGALMGVPMAFIRLAGCSVNCGGCDTNYTPVRSGTVEFGTVVPSPSAEPVKA